MGFWISLIASVVASWLTASVMKNSLRQEGGTKVNKNSNIAQIPVVYGERKVNPTRVFVANSGGDNTYLYIILALCEGEIESITDVYLDDILSTDSKYSGLLSISKYLGSDTQAADQTFIDANIGWTSAHQLKGVAYLAVRLKWSSDAFSGIPSIQAVVKGRKIWNGTTTAYSTNPAWCLRDYLTNARYGKGLPASFINDTLFSAAAAKCDSLVTPYTGGTQQKIFECNAVLETDRAVLENAKILLSGFRGLMPYSNGQYGVIVEDQGSSTFSFDESLIIGGISIQSETKKNRFNRVIAVFDNPDANWQSDQIEYPPTGSAEETQYLTEDGGIELEKRITLDTITNTYTAQDIAEIALKRSRNSLACTFVSTSEALNIAVGDIVDVTHSTPAWEAKPFRVNALSLRMDGTVSVELIEHQDSIYPWSTKTAADDIPGTNLPNPFYIAPITGLSVIPRASELYDGTILSILDITWDASPDSFVRRYEVDITPAGGNTTSIVTVNNTHQFYVIDVSVDYTVVVRAENAMGSTSGDVSSGVITPVADTDPPAVPSSVSVNGTFQKIILGWTNPTDKDLSHVEIKRSNDSQEINATTLGTSKATSWTDGPLHGAVTRHYWIRATDTSGNSSAWVSMGSGTSIRLIADDFDDGVIDIDFINPGFVSDTRALHNKLDTSAITNLAQLMDTYKSREILNTEIAHARQEISADVRDSNVAIATSKLELAALINDNSALITSEQIARADADSAIALNVSTLSAIVGDNSTTLTTHAEVVNGVSAQYSVTVNNNGHVSGFGLVSDIIDGNPTSAFIIEADQFAIGSAGNYPFVYYANDTTVTKDGIDYVLAAGTYIQDAHIQHGSITNAHIYDLTVTAAQVTGILTVGGPVETAISGAEAAAAVDATAKVTTVTDNIYASGKTTINGGIIETDTVKADSILMDGNIEFANTSSGVQFGKDSLGHTAPGAFFGRSGNVAGFNISSATSGIYADSEGTVALNNVRLYSGVAGSPFEYPNTGTYTANISSLTTAISVIIIGGGGGACNNATSGTSTGNSLKRAGTSGTDSYIKWYSGLNGTGTILGTSTGIGGAGLAAGSVGSNTSSAAGTTGQASSKAPGGTGGTYGYNYSGTLPGSGSFGSGGGGAANGSRSSGTPNAPVNQTAQAGGTISQLLNKPVGAQSIEIHVGTGGAGGAAFPSAIIYAGGNGGDGFVSYADPNSGGIEIDLTEILNRLTALEA